MLIRRGDLKLLIDFLPFLILLIPAYIIYRLCIIKSTKSNISKSNEIMLGLFFLYILALIKVTLFPIYINVSFITGQSINLVPFKSILGTLNNSWYMVPLKNIGGNCILLAPLGFFLPLLMKRNGSLRRTVLIGFAVSLTIEFIQLLVPQIHRSFDVDDLILNTIGIIIGYSVFKLLKVKGNKNIKKNIHS
jgi:glycopeptide antibiotics resistance protein